MPNGAAPLYTKTFTCHYCGEEFPAAVRTVDHIVPVGRGGVSERFNYVDACAKCNVDKGDLWPSCRCNRCRRARRLHWTEHKINKDSPRPS